MTHYPRFAWELKNYNKGRKMEKFVEKCIIIKDAEAHRVVL